MAYNTGNPVGSGDPRDFADNMSVLDQVLNDPTAETIPDRTGNERKTWARIEQLAAELEAAVAASELAATVALAEVATGVIKTQTIMVEHHAFT